MELFALVEGQTLLCGGRFRFLRRIGTGTFAVILRALDVHSGVPVAIKCMQRAEFNAIGAQEADVLRRVGARDPHAHCAVVCLLGAFEEQGVVCLVLELLGDAVLDVSRWGPWRQPMQEQTRRSPASARRHKLHAAVGARAAVPAPASATAASPIPVAATGSLPPVTPLPLDDVRQIAVHLCGALAFLHDQHLIHADLKPENIVRRPASSGVKLIDLGNCIEAHKIPLYYARRHRSAQRDAAAVDGGFDVQTLAYRAPEVAAGLEISPAIDMWSLGCVLLECATGEPLFTTSPAVFGAEHVTGGETESEVILRQVELLVNGGRSLSATHPAYRAASCYRGANALTASRGSSSGAAFASLHERLETATPASAAAAHAHFHDFVARLLDVDPAARVGAKAALLHPFLQAFFPFELVFGAAERTQEAAATRSPVVALAPHLRLLQRQPSRHKKPRAKRRREPAAAEEATGRPSGEHKKQNASSLRAALKLIPPLTKHA